MNVAVVGLGNMGAAILHQVAKSGAVTGFDISGDRRRNASSIGGARLVDDLADLRNSDVVILSLPSPQISTAVVSQLMNILPDTATVIETSTVLPDDVLSMRRLVEERGGRLVDAAVFSGVAGMQAGKAKLLVGGVPDESNDPMRPVLERISTDLLFFADPGAGMAAKVINNAVAHAVMVILSEAAALADAYGIGSEPLTELLVDPEGGLIRPLNHRYRERIRNGDYEGGMPTSAALKDSRLALALAQARSVPLFAIQGSHTVYELANAAGLGSKDYASIATLWEAWLNTSFTD
ncbi:NAD(P)-dependent oxidoreductase [Salinibacterium sp. ZJ450]|uniref:NAD(P)-dependent oxidoreductase n=1 Tax=Salinibacterium sp. ZJ450 TaxID=2708338 RepID=UPI0014225092|nr:NAD(P)-dependent oxidoreductase [Salinibacterium sp. ZJ450]